MDPSGARLEDPMPTEMQTESQAHKVLEGEQRLHQKLVWQSCVLWTWLLSACVLETSIRFNSKGMNQVMTEEISRQPVAQLHCFLNSPTFAVRDRTEHGTKTCPWHVMWQRKKCVGDKWSSEHRKCDWRARIHTPGTSEHNGANSLEEENTWTDSASKVSKGGLAAWGVFSQVHPCRHIEAYVFTAMCTQLHLKLTVKSTSSSQCWVCRSTEQEWGGTSQLAASEGCRCQVTRSSVEFPTWSSRGGCMWRSEGEVCIVQIPRDNADVRNTEQKLRKATGTKWSKTERQKREGGHIHHRQ